MFSCLVRSRSLACNLKSLNRFVGTHWASSISRHASYECTPDERSRVAVCSLTQGTSVFGPHRSCGRSGTSSHWTSCQNLRLAGFHTSSHHQEQTKALTVWQNVRELPRSPLPALTLGLSGLIPFIAAPVYMITTGVFLPSIAYAQLAYGASILSFLGGVRWGFTLPEDSPLQPDWLNLGYSVMPSLVAWVGLLVPQPWSLLTVMGGLGLAAFSDLAVWGYPAWLKGLRFLLSMVAILALWTSCMCAMLLPAQSTSKDNTATLPTNSTAPSDSKEDKSE